MFKVNCYSAELTYSQHIEMSVEQIMGKCTFEYGIEVPAEVYLAVQPRHLCVLPLGFKGKREYVKVFYFKREFVPNDPRAIKRRTGNED